MKIFKILAVALVAMLGFTACDKECGHDFIEYDHSADLVGTWTCLAADYAEALVINADGSVVSTGIEDGRYWENVRGNLKTVNNKMTMTFEDDDNWEGRFEMVAGVAFTIYEKNGESFTFRYCANDLAEEVVGMWVCNDAPNAQENDISIISYFEDGVSTFTGMVPNAEDYMVTANSTYKVVGDLLFQKNAENSAHYIPIRLTYAPNGTAYGDILTQKMYIKMGNGRVESAMTYLRIKQYLDLTGTTYDYSSAYVSNAKGKDEDFSMLGHTFNMANINAGNFDMLFRSELFCVDLNTNTITQHFLPANGQDIAIEIPITVEGNKVTLDLSAENPAYRKVDMYMFQDADNSQLHMYMHTNDFINYFANMELYNLLASGEIDKTDAAAIEKVYTDMEARVESINVSFVMKARK